MNKNLFLAVGLSMMVYGLWLMWMARYHPQPLPPGREAVPAASPAPAVPLPKGEGGKADGDGAPAAATRLIPWSGAGARVQFGARGGALAGYVFEDVSGPVELLPLAASRFLQTWPEVEFAPAPGGGPGIFALEGVHPSGVRLRKEFSWAGPAGIHRLKITAANPTRTPVQLEAWSLGLGPGLDTVASERSENPANLRVVASYQEPRRKTPTVKALEEGESGHAWNWVGVDNRYFLAAAFVSQAEFPTAEVSKAESGEAKLPQAALRAAPATLAPGGARSWEVPFYLGAKDYAALRQMGRGLDAAVDFGFFGFLGKPAFQTLRFLRRLVGNYGVAIIVFTVIVQLLMMPMTLKSMRASRAMQKLQPKIQEIQKKYADNPGRMNVEMMELYKSSGTNPLGGCLPLLAQMPIFIALFTMLRNCWELHGAPFALWLRDLSAADPYHALPLAMGGLMFVQQKLNPAAGDPTQQKIFMFMPVMFVFMFWSFPSGLVLYWMVSSLWGLGQQLVFQRYWKA